MPGLLHTSVRVMFAMLLSMLVRVDQVCAQQPALQTLSTRHYDLHTDFDEATATKLGKHMDNVFDAYTRLFAQFEGHSSRRLDAYVFRRQRDYLEFLLRKFGTNGTGSGGMFVRRGDEGALVVWEGDQGFDRVRKVLQHEGFHQFASDLFPGIPIWANEGFAELFEEGVAIGDEFFVGAIPRGTLLQLKRASAEKVLIKFDSFFLIESQEWKDDVHGGSASLNYMQAWSLVHFFLYAQDARWQDDFLKFLALLNKGMSWQPAFSQVFGTDDYSEIQDEYLLWLDNAEASNHRAIIHELEYLATGMHALHGVGIHPNTLQLLRSQLQTHKWKFESDLFGQTTILSEATPGLFELPLGGSGTGPRLVLADDRGQPFQAGVPPGSRPWNIRTVGLEPFDFMVRWKNPGRRQQSFTLEHF